MLGISAIGSNTSLGFHLESSIAAFEFVPYIRVFKHLAEGGNIITAAQMFGVFFKPNSFASASFILSFHNE